MRTTTKAIFIIVVLLPIQCAIPSLIYRVKAEQYSLLGYPGNWCLSFDGVSNYISCGPSTIFALDNLTIEAWVKPKYIIQTLSDSQYGHQYGIVLCRGGYSLNPGYCLYFSYDTGLLNLQFSGAYNYHTDRAVWENSSWYDIAVTYDRALSSGNLKFYVNGTLDSQHDSVSAITSGDFPLIMGCVDPSAFGGYIDEVRLWNVSRAQSEINDTMLRTLNITEVENPNLVGYWRFDEGNGTTSHDYSRYGHDVALPPVLGRTPQWSYVGAPIIPEFPSLSTMLVLIATSSFTILMIWRRLKARAQMDVMPLPSST